MDKIELLGGACFSHGPYTFYKAVRISNNRVLRLGSFFLTKLWSDADLVSIGELQLVWIDSRGPNTPLASLRLYFLPENTPDGRRDSHGEDEVLSISEKVVVRVHDLVTCLSPSLEWSWGREVSFPSPSSPNGSTYPQVLSDPGLDFSDVERHQKEYEALSLSRRGLPPASFDTKADLTQTKVVVLSYSRYCRYRAVLKRLEGSKPSWQSCAIAAALGGFKAVPGTRVLFCRDTFDYPDLETHELLCNHLAPKLKGRPRRKRKKARSLSPENESSNESEASVASSAAASTSKASSSSKENNAAANNSDSNSGSVTPTPGRPPGSTNKRREDRQRVEDKKPTAEEKKFVNDVHSFMINNNTPLPKMPLLGYRQIDLFLFYKLVQELGGYDRVSANRLWKSIYDEMGGNAGSTSAATITRRHYERLLLDYERYLKGDHKLIQASRRKTPSLSDVSEDSMEVKREAETPPPSETPPPNDSMTSPAHSILSTSPFLPGDRSRSDTGKTSSLRSVRVKPERLKSLNSMIATSIGNSTAPANQQQLPSPTALNATSSSGTSSPLSTPPSSTTPTGAAHNSVLERQLNSPLITQQVPPPCSPTGLPVNTVTTNAGTVVTLTPPPEKDMIKLDPKQTMLAQGKENIPLYEAKSPNFVDKPCSPEVIDLETENESGAREKLIIPSFKKRKLEILREGGLEVTAVDCADTRPSVIQPIATTTTTSAVSNLLQSSTTTTMNTYTTIPISIPTISANITTTAALKAEEKPPMPSYPTPTTVIPKLINVTVTPDIGHMVPRSDSTRSPAPSSTSSKHSSSSPTPSRASPNSRVINLGNSNSSLMHLYSTANMPMPHTMGAQGNPRFMGSPNVPNGRPMPGKITQGRSIFGSSDRMVYGNPKDILTTPKYMPSAISEPISLRSPSILQAPSIRDEVISQNESAASGVLDLTQKSTAKSSERPSHTRPSLEIVKVPVVIRPNREVNPEARNFEAHRQFSKPTSSLVKETSSRHIPPHESQRKTPQFVTGSVATNAVGGAYVGVLDSRTMATNNLEITLVSPKKTVGETGIPQLSPSSRSNNVASPMPNQRRPSSRSVPSPTPQHMLNGKAFPKRVSSQSTPLSPYTPRKSSSSHSSSTSSSHHPVIPNVPNLSHLNAAAMAAQGYPKPNHMPSYPPYYMMESNLSEAEKIAIQQQQRHLEVAKQQQQARESEANSRRSSIPTLPPGFLQGMSPASQSFMDHHLKARLKDQFAGANNGSISPFMLDPASAEAFNGSFDPIMAAMAVAARSNNQIPMIDPAQLSAFYSGLLSTQGPALAPNPAAPFMIGPEFSTYYKELLASTAAAQQSRSMGGQPAAPTTK